MTNTLLACFRVMINCGIVEMRLVKQSRFMRKPKSEVEVVSSQTLIRKKERKIFQFFCYPLLYIETTLSRDVFGRVGQEIRRRRRLCGFESLTWAEFFKGFCGCITYMGVSGPSLLIESTDSMIHLTLKRFRPKIFHGHAEWIKTRNSITGMLIHTLELKLWHFEVLPYVCMWKPCVCNVSRPLYVRVRYHLENSDYVLAEYGLGYSVWFLDIFSAQCGPSLEKKGSGQRAGTGTQK